MFSESDILKENSTQDAQIQLVNSLLFEPFFQKLPNQRILSMYPWSAQDAKNVIVIEFLKSTMKNKKIFDSYMRFDYLMGASNNTRGHFIHQFEVFLIGVNIILMSKKRGLDLHQHFYFNNFEEIINCWLITSTMHDIGYPFSGLEALILKIRDLYSELGHEEIVLMFDGIDFKNLIEKSNLINSFVGKETNQLSSEKSIGDTVLHEICKSLGLSGEERNRAKLLQEQFITEKDHGYISSIFLYKMVEKLIDDNQIPANEIDYWRNALKYAVSAIALHNVQTDKETCVGEDIVRKIDFERNPYAFLLYFIDNIHDWERRLVTDTEFKYPDYFLVGFSVIENKKLIIEYLLSHEKWDSKTCLDFKSFLDKKRYSLNLVLGEPKLGITVEVRYKNNKGDVYDPVTINI